MWCLAYVQIIIEYRFNRQNWGDSIVFLSGSRIIVGVMCVRYGKISVCEGVKIEWTRFEVE